MKIHRLLAAALVLQAALGTAPAAAANEAPAVAPQAATNSPLAQRMAGVWRDDQGGLYAIVRSPESPVLRWFNHQSGASLDLAERGGALQVGAGPAAFTLVPDGMELRLRTEGSTPPGQRFRRLKLTEQAVAWPVGATASTSTLKGTLLLPYGEGPCATVVLAPADGANLRQFAEVFAAQGVAALVYDRREGSAEQQADDAVAAAAALAQQPMVDARRIGVWSHGGWLAPMAALRAPQLDFVVAQSPGAAGDERLNAGLARLSASLLVLQGSAQPSLTALAKTLEGRNASIPALQGPGDEWPTLRRWLHSHALGRPSAEFCATLYQAHLKSDLALDVDAFDQTEGQGFRALALEGCNREGADLIEAYIAARGVKPSVMRWHVAQLRASAGQTELALAAAKASLDPQEDLAKDPLRWNAYVRATIAFLERDKAALQRHRDEVAAGRDAHFGNALNLRLLDALIQYADTDYAFASTRIGR